MRDGKRSDWPVRRLRLIHGGAEVPYLGERAGNGAYSPWFKSLSEQPLNHTRLCGKCPASLRVEK